jgi:hypothetical protein
MTRTGRAPRSLSLAVIDKRGEAPTYLLCIQFIVGISEGRKEDSCALAAAVSVGSGHPGGSFPLVMASLSSAAMRRSGG